MSPACCIQPKYNNNNQKTFKKCLQQQHLSDVCPPLILCPSPASPMFPPPPPQSPACPGSVGLFNFLLFSTIVTWWTLSFFFHFDYTTLNGSPPSSASPPCPPSCPSLTTSVSSMSLPGERCRCVTNLKHYYEHDIWSGFNGKWVEVQWKGIAMRKFHIFNFSCYLIAAFMRVDKKHTLIS